MDVKECCALGRSGYLGEFYDAREDKFCSGSLFNTFNLPSSCVSSVDVNSVNVEYTFEDSYTKRFEKLDVNGDLKVSVFAGLLDLKGSGKYLTDDKTSSRSVKGTVLYNVKTKEEKINIYNEELKQYFTLDGIANTSATHFVGGIVWGANTFASFECTKERSCDLRNVTGNLSAELKKFVVDVKGVGDQSSLEENNSLNYKMKIYGDVIPIHEELPQTKVEALDLLRKTPSYISKCNNGKGKPISFTLYPLTEVAKMLNIQLKANPLIHALDSATVLQTEQVFNELLQAKQMFTDFYEDLTSSQAPYFPMSTIRKITDFRNNSKIAELELCNEIKKELIKARSDPSQSFCVKEVLKNFIKTEYSPDKIREFLAQHKSLQEKMDMVLHLKTYNVRYMTSKSFGVGYIRSQEKDFYALVFRETDQLYSSQKWKDNYDLFVKLLTDKQETESKVFYVFEIANESGEEKKDVSIFHSVNKVVETEDLLKDLLIKHSFALAGSSAYEFSPYKPNKSSLLKIRCPGSIYGKCGLQVVNWKCHQTRCNEYLYYGFDGFLYCKCGKAKLNTFSYKCTDANHGAKWTSFLSDDDLLKMIEELLPPEELNILILGETGVGKSTFINAFANYLTYDTLEEAEQDDLVSLISTSFTVTDENYQEKLVKFGEDPNESGRSGQSQTQACFSYTFPRGDKLIRLIDTPGIGDTSGPDKDTRNFENILSFIANYSVLHGICILLKPNNSRISVMFRFCIQELLCHIHKGASENIVFLFTNARGCFYRPGDTLPSLRTLLEENAKKPPHVEIALNKSTIYCLDNESFRFLVAIKNEIMFPEDEKNNFKSSWDKSVTECVRMLSHFFKIKPHPIQETVSLNDARKLIIFLSKPLCDITQNIQTNILTIQDQERKIQQAGEDIAKLQQVLYVPIIDLEQKFFKEPRTVCTAEKCVTVRTSDGKKKIDYTQICHNPCQLQNITAEIVNNVELLNCWAMDGKNYCRACGCSFAQHMHIYYENMEVSKQKVDSNVQQEIKTKQDQKVEKSRILRECQIRREKLKYEQDVITRASAQFAHFLRTNAIAPYNDALRDYLNHLIVVERQKCAYDSDNQRMVEDLIKMKNAYEEQVRILELNFNAAGHTQGGKISPTMINDIVKELYSLELNGLLIKNAAEKQRVQRQETEIFRERMYHPIPPKRGYKKQIYKVMNTLKDFFYSTETD